MAQTDIKFTFDITSNSFEDDSKTQPIQLDVLSFRLEEGLNAPYVLDVELVSFDSTIDFDAVIDQPATFTIYQGDVAVRHVHGLVSHFEQGKTGHRRTHYRAIVEPSLARLSLTSDWRVFQQQNASDVISSVLKANQIDNFEINSNLEHVSREYLVQNGVLDASFIDRLAAQEGYVYRIQSGEGSHRLLFTDIIQTFGALEESELVNSAVIYNPNAGGDRPSPALRDFVYTQRVRTAKQTQREYSFKNPRYNQEHSVYGRDVNSQTHAQSTRYEQYDYGVDAQYKQDAVGQPFTQTKIQAHRNDATTATCVGDDARLEAGVAFQLQGHPRSDMNVYWRPVYIIHTGTQRTASEEDAATSGQSTSYEQTATLVLATDNWKANIPAPHKITGSLIAHVTTPSGEELYCDEFGRVKVIFPWQRHEQPNENSSCWIRVAQNWAGAGWGHIAIPRSGQEVIVEFLGGDESQPIITGRTYDANHPTPYKLPALKTQQTTKSKEHKGSGYNELLIDDTTGEIKTQLHTTHQTTQLTMGYLTHPRKDDGSGEHRGDGFEVRTDAHGAIRAGKGMYISTDKREHAEGKQLDMQEAIAQLEHALEMAKEMQRAHSTAQTAQNDTTDQEAQLNEVYTELTKAGLMMSSPEGIAATSPKSIQISSGENHTVTTGKSTDITAWEDVRIGAKDNLSLLAVDDELKVVANKGQMKIQAQNNKMEIAAQKAVKMMSTDSKVNVVAAKEILLTSGGAYIRIKEGNIELHTPGVIDHKGAAYPFAAPTTLSQNTPQLASPTTLGLNAEQAEQMVEEAGQVAQFVLLDDVAGLRLPNQKYKILLDDEIAVEGVTNEQGETEPVYSNSWQKAVLLVMPNSEEDQEPLTAHELMLTKSPKNRYTRVAPYSTTEVLNTQRVTHNDRATTQSHQPEAAVTASHNFGLRRSTPNLKGSSGFIPTHKGPDRYDIAIDYLERMEKQIAKLDFSINSPLVEKDEQGKPVMVDDPNFIGKKMPKLVDDFNDGELYENVIRPLQVIMHHALQQSPLFGLKAGTFTVGDKGKEKVGWEFDSGNMPRLICTKNPIDEPDLGGAFLNWDWACSMSSKSLQDVLRFMHYNTPKKAIATLASVIYHEARHCQQFFWGAKLMLNPPPNLASQGLTGDFWRRDLKPNLVKMLDVTPFPMSEPYVQTAFERMILGWYYWEMIRYLEWFEKNESALIATGYKNNEKFEFYRQDYEACLKIAKNLYQGAGYNGKTIDIKELPKKESYRLRPWEEDAFSVQEIIEAYARDHHIPAHNSWTRGGINASA